VIEMNPNRKIVLLLLIPVILAIAGLVFFKIDLSAETENRDLERLFNEMGVLQIPPAAEPVEIQLKDQNGRLRRLSEFRGKIVFINFWTTWCLACVVEMPSMEKLHQKFKDKDFVMVGINLQESEETILKFYKEHRLTFTTLLDATGDVGAAFRLRGIPTTIILDKNGIIIGTALGPREWDSRDSFALFEYLTDNTTAGANSKSSQ
jgi:thiol-disulfide isomerase/thioredoxin